MKFSQEDPTDGHRIQSYDATTVVIQSGHQAALTTMTTPFILSAGQLTTVMSINTIVDFKRDDVYYFKSLDIEVLILGQGVVTWLAPSLMAEFSAQAIGVEQMPIGPACRTYNLLISEGRRVALAINFD
jgi:uncharacterized protein